MNVKLVGCHDRLLATWKLRLYYTAFTLTVEGFAKPLSAIRFFSMKSELSPMISEK